MNTKRKKVLSYALSLSILLNCAACNQHINALVPSEFKVTKQTLKQLKKDMK